MPSRWPYLVALFACLAAACTAGTKAEPHGDVGKDVDLVGEPLLGPPSITSFTPTIGFVGNTVTIKGTNFGLTTLVRFGNTLATFSVVNDTTLTAKVPSGAVTGKISVNTLLLGSATSAASFTVVGVPTISSISPTTAKVPATLTISGTNFYGTTKVAIGALSLSGFTVNTANAVNTITVTVPIGAATGAIAVTNPAGTRTGPVFTVQGPCTGVVCAAADACHVAGVCSPTTGLCSNPLAANGTACSDGNACTRSDSCQAGVCTGSNPVVCAVPDQCHTAGTCNTATGACSNPAVNNGTSCNDGNACTQSDSCQTGVCTGSNPIMCMASDQCHVAGTCNSASGACSNPAAVDGTACNDGNMSTVQDMCTAGACAGTNTARRVDLQILVLSAGDVGTAMVKAGLIEGLVPFTEIDLNQAGRPVIDGAFLADTVALARRAKFQAVVLPNEAPSQLSPAELAALDAFEREFKVRQFDSFIYPSPAVGLNWPVDPAYLGPFDGFTANLTAAGKSGAFAYLNGPIPFEDLDPAVFETYGYLSTPLAGDATHSFAPLVTVPIPGADADGVLLGVYNDNGREQLVMTCAVNQYQLQQQALFHGILNWLTYGVHLGTERNYFSVHVDDVFLPDSRWSTASNCTVGDDCAPNVTAPDIIMTPADVDYLLAWQQSAGLNLDMAFNGGGYDEAVADGQQFPLGDKLLQSRASLRWLNHTYTHAYLGCIQDFSVVPFRCATNLLGQVLWATQLDIYNEIHNNQTFASQHNLPIAFGELVTGEHSGLRRTPQEPSDNPNLASALTSASITFLGADNSRETQQRVIGSARTVPRYPMNIFYNVATKTEEVDEYNWIYNSAADGGSGICENNPSSTCIDPLDPATGFDGYIVPLEARNALVHVLSNSPRPHYAHQSNLTEDRILYPVLDGVIAYYRTVFAGSTPLVNDTVTALGTELQRQGVWSTSRANVSGYVQDGQLVLKVSGGVAVGTPLTAPTGTTLGGADALAAYGGYRTGWSAAPPAGQTFALPGSVGYAH